MVNDVRLTENSPIAVLRAACKTCDISQSGGKRKLFRRLVAFHGKQQLVLAKEVANQVDAQHVRQPDAPILHSPPKSAAEIQKHLMTHIPYAPWCEACISGKARPDRHEEASGKAVERALPVISYDFFYTGMDPQPVDEQGEHDHTKNLCCLVITDSASGFVHCVPVDSKLKRFRHIVVEIVRCISTLGYSEVCLRNDQEPFLLRVQSQVQKVRREQGHRTILENPAVGDSQGNGRVESAVHQIRQQANVLLHHVRERTGLEINHQHSIFAWAFVHSAFLISRFATRAGCTPFELIAGRPFQGAFAVFAEPVMAYVAVSGMPKGKAKWQRAVALTKSGLNDMYIVACNGTIRLTRSVRRCFDNWKDALEQFQQVNVKPWELEGVIGARMAPSVLKKAEPLALGIPLGTLGRGDEAASDPPSENEKDQRQKDAEQAGNKQAGEKATLKQIPPLLNASSSGGGSAMNLLSSSMAVGCHQMQPKE